MSNPIITKRPLTLSDSEKCMQCLSKERTQNAFRQLREKECYPIINRGGLWYALLTDEQKAELKEWYQAWLDVTETMVVPDKPKWLD